MMKKLRQKMALAIRPIPKMTVTQWADKYLRLPSTAAEPGRYKTARAPYVKEIMDAFTQDEVQKIVFKSSSQSGKSQLLLAIVGRFAQLDPCNIMIVQPTLETAQDFSKDRLERMIQDTPILTPLFYDAGKTRNSNQTILSKMYRGGRIVLVGANSPSGLASKPIRILLCDECDRYPASSGDEGDPIALAEKRQTTYWNYKTFLCSTPTVENISRIDKEYLLGTQEKWMHACPNCGEFHFLNYKDMQVDFEEKNKTITVNSVNWKCPDCGFEFSELTMKNAAQKYIADAPDALKNGVRSFWVNGFSSNFLNWKTIMREYLEAKGLPEKEAVVFNTRFGLSYQQVGEYEDECQFLSRLENYGAEIPSGVLILTAGVDVQKNRLEYEICGWGIDEEFFGIMRGAVYGMPTDNRTWQELDAILNRDFKFADGRGLKVARTFIDSGYSTNDVYNYCRQNIYSGKFAIKGLGGAGLAALHKTSFLKDQQIYLTVLGVDTLKSEIFSRMAIETPGAGYFHWGIDDTLRRSFDEIYFKQLVSERRVIRQIKGILQSGFETAYKGVRNEALDLTVYSLAALKSLKIDWKNFSGANVTEIKKTPAKKIFSQEQDIWG